MIAKLGPREFAEVFVDLTFLGTSVKFIQDQVWLKEQAAQQEVGLAPLVKKFFEGELEPILFFHPTLERAEVPDLALFLKNIQALHLKIVDVIARMSYPENKVFAETALRLMSDLFEFENRL